MNWPRDRQKGNPKIPQDHRGALDLRYAVRSNANRGVDVEEYLQQGCAPG